MELISSVSRTVMEGRGIIRMHYYLNNVIE